RVVCIPPCVFDELVKILHPHSIFHNQFNHAQLSVNIQLAIFLYCAGHYGNAASVADIADWAGVSKGTVVNCTWRVAVALLDLHDDAISKPTEPQRNSVKLFTHTRSSCGAWRNGFLAVDGTLIKLYQKPGLYGESFYNKNSDYAIAFQVNNLYIMLSLILKTAGCYSS
ncbi:hypothetical protein OBBRIDRAFT_734867, partial [Obba rivulosa]